MSPFKRIPSCVIAAIILGAALLAAYSNSFRAPFIFDDELSITENPTLRSWKTAFLPPSDSGRTVSGRPLLNATLAINYALSGKNVVGYHATNLLIHFLAALTLFGLIRCTLLLPSLREKFATHAVPLALIVSALWALHPLQTESVTYTIQRAESLAGLFYLLTLYCFVRSIDTPASSRHWQFAAFSSCLAGMASKEVMVSAPLIVFLFDRAFVSGSFSTAWRSHKNSTWPSPRPGFYSPPAFSRPAAAAAPSASMEPSPRGNTFSRNVTRSLTTFASASGLTRSSMTTVPPWWKT